MKSRRFILRIALPVLMVLLGVGCCLWFHLHPRQLPLDQCSDLYRQYHKIDGINASYLKEFSLDDTLTVAVTILQATDSAAWAQLISDFKIPPEFAKRPANIISTGSRLFPKGHPELTADTILTNNELLVHYRQEKTLYIFHFESEAQFDAVILYKYHQQKKQSSKLIEK